MSPRRPPARGADERPLKVRVKSGKKRTLSSKLWLERQLNDPYVARARREGFRSRAAFKLAEVDDKHRFLKSGARVVDLGAAPGGWSQVAAQARRAQPGGWWRSTFSKWRRFPASTSSASISSMPAAPERLKALLGGTADVVLTDMAANATGHKRTDHIKIMALVEAAAAFAREVLAPGRRISRQGDAGRHRGGAARRPQARLCQCKARQAGGEPRGFRRALFAGDRLSRVAHVPAKCARFAGKGHAPHKDLKHVPINLIGRCFSSSARRP